MCNVSGGYFTRDTQPIQTNCTATLSDSLGVGARVSFDMSEVTHNYKVAISFDTPSGSKTATSPLIQVISNQVFDIPFPDSGISPENGTYSISQVIVYDSGGNEVCSGVGSTGQCETLTIGGNGTGTEIFKCKPSCTKNQVCLAPFGFGCVERSYLFAGAGAVLLLLLLQGGNED